jgi:hypothetical protein
LDDEDNQMSACREWNGQFNAPVLFHFNVVLQGSLLYHGNNSSYLRLFAGNYNIEGGGKQTRRNASRIGVLCHSIPNTGRQLLAQLSSLLMPEMVVG